MNDFFNTNNYYYKGALRQHEEKNVYTSYVPLNSLGRQVNQFILLFFTMTITH